MLITINKDNEVLTYDVNLIESEDVKRNASIIISKVGSLEVQIEALSFANSSHRANLEALLKDCPEALVENKEEEVVEDIVETPTEDGGPTDSKD